MHLHILNQDAIIKASISEEWHNKVINNLSLHVILREESD